MKQVAVIGASGYAGRELLRLLARHPGLRLAAAMSARPGAAPEPPALPLDPVIDPLELGRVEGLDGVFLCTPHGAAAPLARACLERGAAVVDLSADFRLRDPALYRETYGHEHPAPELLGQAVYGLTELARERLPGARLVANPGCYPTAALLALKPLLAAGLVDPVSPIAIDAKSGVSGAGKAPSERTHFGSVHENFLAYAVGTHRHAPEIRQEAGTGRIAFVPHLLPVFRGILATIYLQPRAGVGASDLLGCLSEAWSGERFVRVYERGLPELDRVQRTNECHLGLAPVLPDGSLVAVISALDNLVKGAAGQALQNMNLVLGLDEAAGLA